MINEKLYITSAIPYVNAAPHIGHAQEFLYADVVRRFHRLNQKDVLYLCGADENALKIFQAAEKANKTPQEFTDLHNQEFQEMAKQLNVQFDIWQRGTDANHHFQSSQTLWSLCEKNGDIYKKSYSGLYCVGCEMFYTEDELDTNGECFEHPGKKLDRVSEENYFFRLSRYQNFIEDLLVNDKLKITPEIRKNEALAFVKRGLPDFSISRSTERARGWGIPVPNDPNQIMYVWFDALNIYQTGIGFSWNENLYKKWAPQDIMIIGKGIIRFHAIYWPAILKSAGLNVPKELFVHGYLTVNGQKMSKTLGNVVNPIEIINRYGTDGVRYYLLREIPSFGDGDFSERRFKELYNADLANGLGNLVARIAKLSRANNDPPNTQGKLSFSIDSWKGFSSEYKEAMESFHFNDVLVRVWETVKSTDKYIDENEPWKITSDERLISVLQKAIDSIRVVAHEIQPFLPDTSQKILDSFAGPEILPIIPLFPRLS